MFFHKHRQNIASLRQKHDVLDDVLGSRNSIQSYEKTSGYLGKPQFEKGRVYLGIAQMGGGVSTLAQMVWGTYFEKNCPCSKGHLLGLGGLNPCQDGLGHLCSEN